MQAKAGQGESRREGKESRAAESRASIAVYAKLAELSVLACPPVNQAHNELIEIIAPTA